ncbi:MAG: hypothetical protein DRG30_04845, partial [Epsilonproteobacteria bacterium]
DVEGGEMNYTILTDLDKLDSINFVPTFIVGFYRQGKEDIFSGFFKRLKDRFPKADIIGCSSESNIYDTIPHIDIDGTHHCIFMCIEMKSESYILQHYSTLEKYELLADKSREYSAIILSANYDDQLEHLIKMLQKGIGKNSFFGAVAGTLNSEMEKGTIFYNGKYISEGTLIWFIDQEQYLLKGVSMHDFDPVGFDLEITHAIDYTIFEIENKPALEMIEEVVGTLDPDSIASFDHPFFITSDKNKSSENIPITAMYAVDREVKSITLYKKVSNGDKLKVAIPHSRQIEEEQLVRFHDYTKDNSIAFLFVCIAFKGHWGEMEPLYLMRLSQNLKVPFIGFHTFGEIGILEPKGYSLMQNQTVTLAVLSENEDNHAAK